MPSSTLNMRPQVGAVAAKREGEGWRCGSRDASKRQRILQWTGNRGPEDPAKALKRATYATHQGSGIAFAYRRRGGKYSNSNKENRGRRGFPCSVNGGGGI